MFLSSPSFGTSVCEVVVGGGGGVLKFLIVLFLCIFTYMFPNCLTVHETSFQKFTLKEKKKIVPKTPFHQEVKQFRESFIP